MSRKNSLALVLLVPIAGWTNANAGPPTMRYRSDRVAFTSGGVGLEEPELLKVHYDNFNLHLAFSQGARGEFIADHRPGELNGRELDSRSRGLAY